MLIFDKKANNDLQTALVWLLREDAEREFPNVDLRNRWQALHALVKEHNADPVPAEIYTVFVEYEYDLSDADNCWRITYRDLEAAKNSVIRECIYIREEEEIRIAVDLLPEWELSEHNGQWSLEYTATGRTWTITKTELD